MVDRRCRWANGRTPRYHTMANTDYPSAFEIDAPHVSLQAETVMPESRITFVQSTKIPPPDLPEWFCLAPICGPTRRANDR